MQLATLRDGPNVVSCSRLQTIHAHLETFDINLEYFQCEHYICVKWENTFGELPRLILWEYVFFRTRVDFPNVIPFGGQTIF